MTRTDDWIRTLALLAALTLLASACAQEPVSGELPDAGPDAGSPDVTLVPPDSTPGPDQGPTPDSTPGPDQGTGPCSKPVTQPSKYKPGAAYWGRKNYIEYVAGDLPVIISSPHGGFLKPSEIPNRTWGVLGSDTGSQEKTFEVANYLKKITGRQPHLIINRLHRSKLDANREIKEAAQGSKWSEQAWTEYHQFIGAARDWVTKRCGGGHYFDFHTNAHSAKWVELGHLLTSSDLDRSDTALNDSSYINKSSMQTLGGTAGVNFPEIVRGPSSLGGLLISRGYKAVPSPKYPHPNGQGFFSGGYNTSRHGSKSGGVIDGTQVESYVSFINNEAGRDDYSLKLAQSIGAFLELHYQFVLEDYAWSPPAHERCVKAKLLKLAGGSATASGSTTGASNEFGMSVTCGNSFALDGPQVYYKVQLKEGTSYEISLTPAYAARFYLFGDTCTPALISEQCKKSGLSGPLVDPTTTKKVTIKATRTGIHTIAVDSRSNPWYGSFALTIKQQ